MYSKTGKRLIIPFSSMRILVFLFISIFSAISVQAQSQDLEKEMQIMVNRVDSLEHELAYLKLTFELGSKIASIDMFNSTVYTYGLSIQLNYYNRNIDLNYAKSNQELYESFQSRFLTEKESMSSLKLLFHLTVASSHFTEDELNVLNTQYDALDNSLDQLNKSMNLYKICVEGYTELVDNYK